MDLRVRYLVTGQEGFGSDRQSTQRKPSGSPLTQEQPSSGRFRKRACILPMTDGPWSSYCRRLGGLGLPAGCFRSRGYFAWLIITEVLLCVCFPP